MGQNSLPNSCGPCAATSPGRRVSKRPRAKLEKGDYDSAHLAMNYWPERVSRKMQDR